MNSHAKIFIDSDVFVALAKEDDANHKKAIGILETLLANPVVFCTSNYVFSETVTVISQRIGHEEAVEFIKKMKSPEGLFEVEWVDAHIEDAAIELFEKQTSKNISFVDCTNMAFLRKGKAEVIFSFDQCYKKNGFRMLLTDYR